ncbi:MAG: efflux RND transporter periplasmic adaptor subunit [Sulfuriferula sp.]
MKQKRFIIVVLIAAAIIIGAVVWIRSSPIHPPAPPPQSPTPTSVGTVVISAAQMAMSGIAVQALPVDKFQPQTSAYASVLDPGPLLQLRGQLRAAQLQTDAARAQAVASQREYQRLAGLNGQDHTVSDKVTEAALATRDTDRAHLAAAQATLLADRDSARSRWGDVLVRWASAARSSQLDALNAGQQVLLSVALPASETAGTPPPTLHIGAPGSAPTLVIARFISPSPLADPVIQSPAYFYLAPRGGLRTGMRIDALLPAGQSRTGVIIPNQAVVWYANRPWVYVQTDATHFVRREISVNVPAAGGWFVAHWQGGERVVTKGAALLFSQEFQPKPQSGGSSDGGDDDD